MKYPVLVNDSIRITEKRIKVGGKLLTMEQFVAGEPSKGTRRRVRRLLSRLGRSAEAAVGLRKAA